VGAVASVSQAATKPANSDGLDLNVLPIVPPTRKPVSILDARDAKAPSRFEVKAPKRAPNIVIVLIDDVGFGHSSAFGGPIKMPTLERLAGQELKYNRFHTTALCSPTRTALLTGQNNHANNAGAVMELATAFEGNIGIRPKSIATLAEILRQNGYSTAAFGKSLETPPWEVSVSGAYDLWPTGSRFDKFYGFIGGWALYMNDGKVVAEGKIPRTQPFAFSGDEGADVGLDGETNVSEGYKQGDNAFIGTISKVVIERVADPGRG
jgi:arylsulfatase